MADPFDVTNNDYQPVNAAPGGVSPDFYRNLLSFGLATMQAGSQPGAQFMGSIGAGGLAAMNSARENSNARMQQQLTSAEIKGKNLSNMTSLNNMNWLRQQQGLPPLAADGLTPITPTPAQDAANPITAQPKNAIAEPGSSAGGGWTPSAGNSGPLATPAEYSKGDNSAPGSTIGGVPASVFNRMTKEEQSAAQTGQAYTMHGYAELGKPYTEFAYARINSEAKAIGETPSKIKQARANFRDVMGADRVTSVYDPMANDGRGGFVAEGAQENVVPPGTPGAGATYRLPPRTLDPAESIGGSAPGAAAAAPGNLNAAALGAAQNAGAPMAPPPMAAPQQPVGAPQPLGPLVQQGGNAGIQLSGPPPDAAGGMPGGAPAQMAANLPGAVRPGPLNVAPEAPPSATAPPGGTAMPAGAVMTGMSPQQHELLQGGAKDLISHQQPMYETANQALASSAIIDRDIRDLRNSGMLSMGAGAQQRLEIAKRVNTLQQVLGVSDENLKFDPNKVASAEGFNKEALRLGFADARSLGAHEAASVINQSIKANPGLQTSALGGQALNGIISEKAQRQKDMFEYKTQRLQSGIDPIMAETEFNKQYPGINYVRRAMSQFAPIPIAPNRPAALNGLLPGTRVLMHGDTGPGKVIPLPPGYMFSLPPTVHSLEDQGGE